MRRKKKPLPPLPTVEPRSTETILISGVVDMVDAPPALRLIVSHPSGSTVVFCDPTLASSFRDNWSGQVEELARRVREHNASLPPSVHPASVELGGGRVGEDAPAGSKPKPSRPKRARYPARKC